MNDTLKVAHGLAVRFVEGGDLDRPSVATARNTRLNPATLYYCLRFEHTSLWRLRASQRLGDVRGCLLD